MESGSALRARYPEAERCACVVDGQACAPERVSVRVMNFGQHWRTAGIVDVPYRIELPWRYVLDLITHDVDDYIEDSRSFPDPDSEIDRALEAAGWPSAGEVMRQPEMARNFIEFFGCDLLTYWLVDGPSDPERDFVLNTIDEIELGDEVVALSGKARRTGMPVRYQDV